MNHLLAAAAAGFALLVLAGVARADEHRYWPLQKTPKGVVQTSFELFQAVPAVDGQTVPVALGQEHMLAQSIAGLAAQAVNEGRSDELVWIDLDNASYKLWYDATKERIGFEERGTFTPWELLERYRDKGIYHGYILYAYDASEGGPTRARDNMDESVNVATSLAGALGGVLISSELEPKAEAMGLKLLVDVRDKTETWCFERYRDRFNRRFMLAQDPKMPNHRAIAIAHRMFVGYGMDSPTPEAYAWLEPLSSILGWNGGDEGGFVSQLSEYGHVLLPSNWCLNVTVTSAGAGDFAWPKPIKTVDPASIDWHYKGSAASFIMSDGDNVQWFMGDFCLSKDYWASPAHGAFPVGWGTPFACLDQACPATCAYLADTQPPETTLNLHAGGYYYPDLLGSKLEPEKRHEILVKHARRLNHYMNRSGGTTLMFLCMDMESAAAKEAYAVYAHEIERLVGMFVIQYYPYEGGDGKVYWVKNGKGIDIPVVTAKYALWANLKHERAGTPAKIARLINEASQGKEPLFSWTIVHTWSGFTQIDDNDEQAENAQFRASDTEAAVIPTKWCVDRLGPHVRAVSPEELLWRIRMQHNPEETQACIAHR